MDKRNLKCFEDFLIQQREIHCVNSLDSLAEVEKDPLKECRYKWMRAANTHLVSYRVLVIILAEFRALFGEDLK